MISICMIVRNEEENLARCLESVSSSFNNPDIVVVDTGSTDKTKDTAKNFTQNVFDYKWNNDFSSARNYSISKAVNDWILVIDADEVVEYADLSKIDAFMDNSKKYLGRISVKNYTESSSVNSKIVSESICRFFNRCYYYYKGTIHEQLVPYNNLKLQYSNVDIIIKHFGYLPSEVQRKEKTNRNEKLLLEAINNNKSDPYLYYQLGKTYFLDKSYNQAVQSFTKSLSTLDNLNYEYVEDLIETYGYSLINTNKYSEALKLVEYSVYFKKSPDFCFLMGLIYMNSGNFNQAITNFIECTTLTNGKVEGITSYLPFYNIGVIFECLGDIENAVDFYSKCKDYIPAGNRLNNLLNNESR